MAQLSRGFRQNNPGNLRGRYFGATDNVDGYAVYASLDDGLSAMSQQLDRYASGKTTGTPLRSVRDIVSTWAPPSDNNPTHRYADFVAQRMGVDPAAQLDLSDPKVKASLMDAMIRFENGGSTLTADDLVSRLQKNEAPMNPEALALLQEAMAREEAQRAREEGGAPLAPINGAVNVPQLRATPALDPEFWRTPGFNPDAPMPGAGGPATAGNPVGAAAGESKRGGFDWQSALINFGANMLAADDLASGLGAGVKAGFEAGKSANKPKRHVVAGGAFILEEYPDGTTRMVPNKEVQDYTKAVEQAKQASLLDRALAIRAARPTPTSVQKMQQEGLDAIDTAGSISADLQSFSRMIDDGKLDLGLMSNWINRGRNFVGLSSEESRNLASFEAQLQKLRNDSLRLNKGVQTEGDSERAWKELMDNINDPALVKQRIAEITGINERGLALQQDRIDLLRSDNNLEPMDWASRRKPTSVYAKPAPKGTGTTKGGVSYRALD